MNEEKNENYSNAPENNCQKNAVGAYLSKMFSKERRIYTIIVVAVLIIAITLSIVLPITLSKDDVPDPPQVFIENGVRYDLLPDKSGYGLYRCDVDQKQVNIRTEISGKPVVEILINAFHDCFAIENLVIPNSIKKVGGGAFEGCTSLKSIVLPSELEIIGGYMFYGCSSLVSVTIPESVTSIGKWAFYRCLSLTNIVIPSGVSRIEESTFWQCASLKNVDIPDSLTYIGNNAFNGCSGLENIDIPASVATIGNNAFQNCEEININCLGKQEAPSGWSDNWAGNVPAESIIWG